MKSLSVFLALLVTLRGESSASPPAADTRSAGASAASAPQATAKTPSLNWQGEAKLRGALTGTPGTLVVDVAGVHFRPTKREARLWPITGIKTMDLRPRRVLLTGYERRGGLRLGTRRFRLDLGTAMPAKVAADLAVRVAKPSRNRNVEPEAWAFGTIPAHHRTPRGGSNGTLRFRDYGIDYVTQRANDSRSWRWADLETLSNLDPYHVVLSGYLETYSFDLKQPLPRELYDRISDEVDAHKTADLRSGGRIEP